MTTQYRAVFDAEISFENGGGLPAHRFLMDVPSADTTAAAVGRLFVASLDLLLADSVTVRNLRIIEESHKGPRHGPSDKRTGMLILIAGPYASGTGGDPDLMRRYLRRLEQAAWPLFEAGHLPMIGEWVALPVLESAGATGPTDPLAQDVLYPTAERLLQRCDAVLRLPGESRGADQDVAIAHARGIPIYYNLNEIPGVVASPAEPRRVATNSASRQATPGDPGPSREVASG
jgi:hypothetical protein